MTIKTFALAAATVLALSTAALAGNSASIVQNGNGNFGGVSQRGHDNDGQIVQFGNGNRAQVGQRGANNNGGIGQDGNFNRGRIRQSQF